MSRRDPSCSRVKEKGFSLIELLVVIAIICTLWWGTAKAADDGKPNFVFILTDDQAPFTFKIYGNEVCHTPNLDRLSAEGITLWMLLIISDHM